MTPETSNGSAEDDQRCYIERLQRIETAARRVEELLIHCDELDDLCEDEDAGEHYELYNVWAVDALKAALEANR